MRNTYLQPTKPSVFANSFLLFIGLLTSFLGVGQGEVILTTASVSPWTVPCGVTEITVSLWGGGGGGGDGAKGTGGCSTDAGGGGGGGGAYTNVTIPVSPGDPFVFSVGAGGAAAVNGGQTTFGAHAADGGRAGTSAVGGCSPGTGGAGGLNVFPGDSGQNGSVTSSGAGGAAYFGGAGGLAVTTIVSGNNGGFPGGGGSGGYSSGGGGAGSGGNGGNGQIVIQWSQISAGVSVNLPSCQNFIEMDADAPLSGTGTWSVTPSAGVNFNSGVNNPNASVTNLTLNTTYTFTWTISDAGCTSSSDQIFVTASLPEANAGFNQSLCSGSYTMDANMPETGFTGTWLVVSGAVTIAPGDENNPNATINSTLAPGACAVLRWTVSGACSNFDDVTICNPTNCQTDPCGAEPIPINGCNGSGTLTGATVTQNPGEPGCGYNTYYQADNRIDIWYTATTDANGNLNLNLTGGSYINAAIYTGTCNDLSLFSCHGWNTASTLNIQETNLPPNTVVYIRVWRGLANAGDPVTICQTASTNLGTIQPGDNTTCTGTFYDSGGSGSNYGNNELSVWTICPDTPGSYVSVTFTFMDTEQPFDQLTIIDGDDASDPVLIVAVPNFSTGSQTFTSSHESGCLTFIFRSDQTITRQGWLASVSCVPDAAENTYPNVCNEQNCLGGCMRTLCGNPSSVPFTGNGFGIQELNENNNGCMDTGERCANWFFINPSSPGTLTMDMYVNNGQNQDFAIWEGYAPSLACPSITGEQPILCNIAPATNLGTGFNSSYSGFNTAYEDDLVITQQQIDDGIYFIMMVQTFSNGNSCPQPTVDITFGGTAGLSCENPILPPSTLDVSLLEFNAVNKGRANYTYWLTSSERNNDFFTVQYSEDGYRWEDIAFIKGAGNSTQVNSYSFNHYDYAKGINYYRLKQTDYDGTTETFDIVSVDNRSDRYVIRTVNTLGQEVNDNFKGIIIDQYSDGSSEKRYNY
jgi:hypothetical protein